MNLKTKIASWEIVSFKTKGLLATFSLILASVLAPAIFAHAPQNQWLTGTIVNSILFIGAYKLPLANIFLIAVIPSAVALSRGLLPLPLATFIPFIILSNILLAVTFKTTKKQLLPAVIISSFVKFSFLYGTVLLVSQKTQSPMLAMLGFPQLFTALAGGLLAILFINIFSEK